VSTGAYTAPVIACAFFTSSLLDISPLDFSSSYFVLTGRGLGQFGGRDDVIYWKCEVGQLLEEVLTVPMTNIRREEALITAAHQQMTEMEYDRRRVTGTLNSSTITTQAVELLTVGRKLQHSLKQPKVRSSYGYVFCVIVVINNILFKFIIVLRHFRGTNDKMKKG